MTEQDGQTPRVRPPDVWGDDPAPTTGSVPLGGPDQVPAVQLPPPGQPLDLSQDPDRYRPEVEAPPSVPGRPLDMSQDPDRYRPELDTYPVVPGRPLDLSRDPDRVQPGDRTLTELLGDGAQEESRDTYTWLVGLVAVLAFLFLVALVARNLGPG